MKYSYLNKCKALVLPVVVYMIFVILSKGRFGQVSTVYTTLCQIAFPASIAWALIAHTTLDIWDFTPGSVIALSGIISGNIAVDYQLGLQGLVAVNILIATAMTMCMFLIFNYLKIPSIISSLGLLLLWESLTAFVYGGRGVTMPAEMTILARSPYCFLVLAVMGALIYFIFNKTRFGYHVRAIGYGSTIATNIGIDLTRTRFLSFLVEGVFLGVASVMSLSIRGASAAAINMQTLAIGFQAIMSVNIGLYLSKYVSVVTGVVIGTFTMKMLSSGLLAIGLNSQLQTCATGVFLLIFMGLSSNQDKIREYKEFKKRQKVAMAKQAGGYYQEG